mmetsp:Transcript_47270/g.111494  ORF Transcript_47270/g.111494 Transcript_47270/m.111494 type:complete len:83 (-) Transcript_47270:503-751(-)
MLPPPLPGPLEQQSRPEIVAILHQTPAIPSTASAVKGNLRVVLLAAAVTFRSRTLLGRWQSLANVETSSVSSCSSSSGPAGL